MKSARAYSMAAAALLGLSGLTFPAGGASALPLPLVQQGTAEATVLLLPNSLRKMVELRRDRKWNRKRHGERSRSRRGNFRHYHDGYFYETPWWALAVPLIIGGAIAAGEARGDDGSHEDWCADRYRSYNPSDNTWVSYGGEVRQCNSPY